MSNWVIGIIMTLVSFVGLFVSSQASDTTMAWVGMFIFLSGLAFVYGSIIKST